MANILEKIIADKKAEVSYRRSQKSLEQLKEDVRSKPKCRNFYKAVTKRNSRGINVIAEVKKASPSAGVGELMDLMIAAAELTLTVLLEVHQADTLLAVRSLIGFPKKGYSILGINNRDLSTMQADLNTTSRLAELFDNKNELVAESGIKSRADVEKLKSVGVRAVLVGQVLCESPDIEKKFTELFG